MKASLLLWCLCFLNFLIFLDVKVINKLGDPFFLKLTSWDPDGTLYILISECVFDILASSQYLRHRFNENCEIWAFVESMVAEKLFFQMFDVLIHHCQLFVQNLQKLIHFDEGKLMVAAHNIGGMASRRGNALCRVNEPKEVQEVRIRVNRDHIGLALPENVSDCWQFDQVGAVCKVEIPEPLTVGVRSPDNRWACLQKHHGCLWIPTYLHGPVQ